MSRRPKKNFFGFLLASVIACTAFVGSCDAGLIFDSSDQGAGPALHRSVRYADEVPVVINGTIPAGSEEPRDDLIVDIIRDSVPGIAEGRYSRITVRVVYGESHGPETLLVYASHSFGTGFDSTRIALGSDYSVRGIELNGDFSGSENAIVSPPRGSASFAALVSNLGQCPDERVQFVLSTTLADDPGSVDGIERVYEYALGRGYTAVMLLGAEENTVAVKNWLACRNLVAWARIGHGSTKSILLDDGVLNATWFNSLPTTALNNKVLFFNSCEVHNDPLQPAVLHAGVKKFIGGITELRQGITEEIFKCFWNKTINKNAAMSVAIATCKEQYSPYPSNIYGISGPGSDYLFDNVPVPTPTTRTISGTVQQNGMGLTPATVRLRKGTAIIADYTTGADGRFSFQTQESGTLSVVVIAKTAVSSQFSGSLTLQGTAMPNIPVVLRMDTTIIEKSKTDTQGLYRFAPVNAGTYRIVATFSI